MARVYVAAPFRTHSSTIEGREYGIVGNGDYKNFLERIEQAIKDAGFEVSLPHREEGQWGEIYIKPDDITGICFNLIRSSDILVVFPATSRGVHLEVGYATALKKIILVFLHETETESTLIKGVSRFTKMELFRYKDFDDIKAILERELTKYRNL